MSDMTKDMTKTDWVVADAQGAILYGGHSPRWMMDVQVPPEGGSVVVGQGKTETDWVTGGAVVPRPANTVKLDGMTLTNVATGATVTIGGTDYTVTDGTVELSFSQPGIYTVKVSAFPMLDATFQVTQA
ncbi:hypothetical protein [Paraburkholderia sp.]|uniref:hypothetical protein n=1 Tax=Paraburkholderia sp. TaxID=1926495 RepID=UPI0039E47EC4